MSAAKPPPSPTARIAALLDLPASATEIASDPSAAGLGARDAVAYRLVEPDGTATVYQFDDYDAAGQAERALAAGTADAGFARSTVNGGLLLRVTVDIDDEDGRNAAAAMISRFAGRE